MEYEFKTKPYQHQIDYLRISAGRQAFALFSDMGTGKSKMLLDEIAALYEQGLLDTVLITTGKGNYASWVGEVETHVPDRIHYMLHKWDGSDSIRVRNQRRELTKFDGLRILVVNIESLAMSTKARGYARVFMGASKRRMTVVDESTLIKNSDAVRTVEMCAFARVSEYRRIASGNPTPDSPLDLWGQFLFLGAGSGSMLGFNSYYAFRARYCVLAPQYVGNGRTVQVPVAFKNLAELSDKISAHSYRVRKEDCLDLPEKIYELREVELTKEQREIYESLRQVAVAELDGSATITASMVVAQLSKMHQVLCGQVTDDNGVEHEITSKRIDALREVVEESGKATIVWCAYRANVRTVSRELRKSYGDNSVVEYYGATSDEDRELAIQKFQDGRAHYFVGTPHSGGRGITLTRAKSVVYYSNTFNLEHRVQSEDRAHRIGQTGSVTYVDLAVPNSLDIRVIKALREKINVSSQIMKDGYKAWVI